MPSLLLRVEPRVAIKILPNKAQICYEVAKYLQKRGSRLLKIRPFKAQIQGKQAKLGEIAEKIADLRLKSF